jgi:hypothetical protein
MYRDNTHFGVRGRTLTEHILSTKQDINKRLKALNPYGGALLIVLMGVGSPPWILQKSGSPPLFSVYTHPNMHSYI